MNGFRHADDWGCECIQVYLTPSRTWVVPELTEAAISAFKEAWAKSGVAEVVAHIPFLVNVASSNSAIRKRAVLRLEKEVDRAQNLGVRYLVLHPGSAGTARRAEGVKRVASGLRAALANFGKNGPKLLVETMAGQGAMVGSRFQEIAEVLELVDRPDVLGVCFDTAHVYFAGYDIRGYDGYHSVMDEFDKTVGVKRILAFHLNDAKTRLGSGHDRHANLGEGRLGLQVFHALVRDKRFAKIPMVLEVPDRDEKSKANLVLLKTLRAQAAHLPVTREEDEEALQLNLLGIAP